MRILISACLLGIPCRYDANSVPCPQAMALAKEHTLIPVCPEVYGGLPTPRPPAERVGDRIRNRLGEDLTEAYKKGALAAADLAVLCGCTVAILKQNSPSCGSRTVYDGTFQGHLIPGEGVCAAKLREKGIAVFGEEEIEQKFRTD